VPLSANKYRINNCVEFYFISYFQVEEVDKGCFDDQDGCEWVNVSTGTGLAG